MAERVLTLLRKRRNQCAMGLAFLCMFALVLGLAEPYLFPSQDGTEEYTGGNAIIDASHKDQGYIMVAYSGGSSKRIKFRVTKGEKTYTYDINQEGGYDVIPLQMGSGTYRLEMFKQVKGTSYAGEYAGKIEVEIADETMPYLYPSVYVWYTPDYKVVELSEQLCGGAQSDEEKVEAVKAYMKENFSYDYDKAERAAKGTVNDFMPNVDETIEVKSGICFDLSATVAALLRLQNIPTQMIIGYADGYYHAWNQICLNGEWQLYDPTAAVTGSTMSEYVEDQRY